MKETRNKTSDTNKATSKVTIIENKRNEKHQKRRNTHTDPESWCEWQRRADTRPIAWDASGCPGASLLRTAETRVVRTPNSENAIRQQNIRRKTGSTL
jgi:hypothetical protein